MISNYLHNFEKYDLNFAKMFLCAFSFYDIVYSMVSTPGSTDFPRGTRVSDASFNPDDSVMETDEVFNDKI